MNDRAAPFDEPRIALESTTRPTWRGYVLFLAIALLLSSRPLLSATGIHLSTAALFYLLAARRWGYPAGLLALLVTVAPSLWWWGVWWYLPLSVGGYLFMWYARRWRLLPAEGIAIYNIAILPLLAWLALLRFQLSGPGIALFALQYALGEIVLATIADLIVYNFSLTNRWPFVIHKPTRSIERVLRTTTNFLTAFMLTFIVASQAMRIHDIADQRRADVRSVALQHVREQPDGKLAGHGFDHHPEGDSARIFFDTNPNDFEERARRTLTPDCPWPVRLGDDGTGGFGTWIGNCEITRAHTARGPVMVAIAYDGDVKTPFPWADYQLTLLVAGAAFALTYGISVSRSLVRAIGMAEDMVRRFGTPNLPMPPHVPFAEIDVPLRDFVARNNNYVAAIEDRDRLTKMTLDLKRSIDLRLMANIRFDPATGKLHFTHVKMTEPPVERSLQVHPGDYQLFPAADGSDEATIEFRTASAAEFDAQMITLRQSAGPLAWESGAMVKFTQPRRLRDLMVQQARLVDLGSMASAISHEIKQPLFTIAIAAESMQLMLDKGRSDIADQQLAGRIARIAEQVDRARNIIERISHYGRTDAAIPVEVDIDETMLLAVSFLSAMLEDRHIAVVSSVAPGRHRVLMSQVALEQVIVNGIQNAADSIQARRDAGWTGEGRITLEVARVGHRLRCTIADNGAGLPPGLAESAFNAFFTTKSSSNGSGLGLFISRQIIIDAGGTIRLRAGDEDEGAALEIDLPPHEPAA